MSYTDEVRTARVLARLTLVGMAAAAAGCASTGAVPRPFPGAPPVVSRPIPGDPPPAPVDDAPAPPAPVATEAPLPASAPTVDASRLSTPGAQALATALDLRGVRYKLGGSDPSGFDCSGLVQYVFARQGIALPRDVRRQYLVGYEIAAAEVRPGDLLFFQTESDGVSHVGIALDGESFVHAPNTRGVVRVERLALPYWSRRLLGARRIE